MTCAPLDRRGAFIACAWRRIEWIIVSCVIHSVSLVCGLDAATS